MTDLIHKYHLYPKKYTIVNSAKIIETEDKTYVWKPKQRNDSAHLYQYLLSRNFTYFPNPVNNLLEDAYELYPYIEDFPVPKEQKAIDLVHLLSLLHNKTTFYQEIDLDDIKNFYEETRSRLNYLENYYGDLQNMIETHVYMSPCEYLLIRNISKIYNIIHFSYQLLQKWYEMIEGIRTERRVLVHNNLKLEHLRKNEDAYLISWNKAKIDSPIYDFYQFFKNHYLDLDFVSLYQIYNNKYPLLEEEKLLLFIHLAIPPKITLDHDELKTCQEISKMFTYYDKLGELISKQYAEESHQKTT